MRKLGLVHVYTGSGKGKTTAALGLCLRAAGNGLKVYIGQFVKGRSYGEIRAIKKMKNIRLEQFGRACFIKKSPTIQDIKNAREGLKKVKDTLFKKHYDMVVLDEINIAVHLKLIDVADVIDLIKNAPSGTEIVLTGRYAPKEIIRAADLVSEIKEIKHYYNKGIKARKGIEY